MRYQTTSDLHLRTRPTPQSASDRILPRGTLVDLVANTGPQWPQVASYQLPSESTPIVPPQPRYVSAAFLAPLIPLPGELTLLSLPRITQARFVRALVQAHSPAAPEAQKCYAAPLTFGLDPAIALAMFWHESQFATDPKAVALRTLNWGNLRNGQGRERRNFGGWAWYNTWEQGLLDWCALIMVRYVGRGLDTLEKAIPVYAPERDHNNVAAYIAAVRGLVETWQKEPA